MKRIFGGAVAVLVVLGGVLALTIYERIVSLDFEAVTDDVHVIFGAGGNVGVLTTDDGAVVVDTMTFVTQGRRIRDLAERIAGGPARIVINTHYHRDHTHGNPAFPTGIRVVSTQRTRDYLLALDADSWRGEAESNAPNETFEDAREIRIGGKTVRLYHPGRGHTGGDLVALFVEDRVIHTGDLFFNGRYPNIDLVGGGSLEAWIGTLDRVLELDFDKVIPGHGPVSDRDGLRAFQHFLEELWTRTSAEVREGASLEQTLRRVELESDAGYDVISIPLIMRLDRDFVVTRAWQEATGSVRPADVPRAPVPRERR